MRHWLKENLSTIHWCAAPIIAAPIFFWASHGTHSQQLAIGVLASTAALLAALLGFEALWWIGARVLSKSEHPQKG
jgi:hypothetical protein